MTHGNDAAFADSGIVDETTWVNNSLTKREYFAAIAMNCFGISEADAVRLQNSQPPNHKLAARFCVDFADALIEALNKNESDQANR